MNLERYSQLNDSGPLANADSYSIVGNVKMMFQNLLEHYFNQMNTEFYDRDVSVIKFIKKDNYTAQPRDSDPIYIVKQYPYTNRKYPFVMISLQGGLKDQKEHIGWDNITSASTLTINNQTIGEVVTGQMYNSIIKLSVAAKSVDDRDLLVTYVQAGLQNYFRSNYMYESPDLTNLLVVNVGWDAVDSELEESPATDTTGGEQFPVFTGTVTTKISIEQQHRKSGRQFIISENLVVKPYIP
jgi:hypothetical protein